ncbi:MAG TPA: phytoene/squalene synthase family protein [Aestuariivirga sp.]|nr:phytoene/squalene synthase family protein [Aestuariivirga sp.]
MSDHCQDLVAKADKDRFLACLFAPAEARPHLFALYAFNVEIARIRETVSEPQIGLVRQQWWLDTLDGIYAGRTPDHPVAQALVSAVAKGDLPKHALQNLVIAREFDLYDDPMPSLADLEGYLGETSSSLIQMAALILGKGAPEAAGLAGVAFGLAGVLRLKKSRYLPRVMVQDLGEKQTIAQLCAHASRRLEEAQVLQGTIPESAMPAFLPVSLTRLYLSRIERGGTLEVTQFRRQITLWWAARNNRF